MGLLYLYLYMSLSRKFGSKKVDQLPIQVKPSFLDKLRHSGNTIILKLEELRLFHGKDVPKFYQQRALENTLNFI